MAFATAEDVAVRFGRDLTDAETAMVEQVIELVTGMIADVVGEDAAWAAALDPVPAAYKALCIEKAISVGTNPGGLRSASEVLGAYQRSETFGDETGLCLTDYERKQILRVARGGSFQSVTLESPYSGDVDDEQPELVL
jgi:hypothetical protein